MPAKRSVYTNVVLKVSERIARAQREARKSKAVPFMEEKVTAAQFRARFAVMGPDEKRAVIEREGIDKVMKILDPESGR